VNSGLGCIISTTSDFIKCAQIPLSSCENQCNLDCEYVSCNKNLTQDLVLALNETYSMCLPKDLGNEEYKNRCDSVEKTDYVLEVDECLNFVPRIIAETKKIPLILIALAFGLFSFILSLIFYRWKVHIF